MGIFFIIIAVVFIAGYFISKSNPEAAAQVEREVVSRAKNESFVKNVAGPYIKTKEKPMSQKIAESPLMGDNESYKSYVLRTSPKGDFGYLVYSDNDMVEIVNSITEDVEDGLSFEDFKELTLELAEEIASNISRVDQFDRKKREDFLLLRLFVHALNEVYVDYFRKNNNTMISVMKNIRNV